MNLNDKTVNKLIYCCSCKKDVLCVQINGAIVYPHRRDLVNLVFWQCPLCYNYVGTHKNSKTNEPLGVIPTPEIREARKHIHAVLDPLWKNGTVKRSELYERLSEYLGYKYHTAMIKSIEEARKIYKWVVGIAKDLKDLDRAFGN